MASVQEDGWVLLLTQLCLPDTAIVRAATDQAQEALKSPESFVVLFRLATGSQLPQVQHLASVLCRRAVRQHWASTPPTIQEEIKRTAFDAIVHPSLSRPVRQGLANVIARIVAVSSEWAGFLERVVALVQSPDSSHKDVGLYLFQALIDSDHLRAALITPNATSVLEVIARGLKDTNADVRVRALSCANTFIVRSHPDDPIVPLYTQLLPSIIETISFCIEEGDDRVTVGFELLSTLADDFMGHIQHLLPDLLRFALTVGVRSSLDMSLRQHALFFIEFTISNKPKSFLANVSLPEVIQLCFVLMTEHDEEEEESAAKYGSQIIDVIALQIPAKYAWKPIMDRVAAGITSASALDRRAALSALAVISEGYADPVADAIEQIIPWVIAGLTDESLVRQAALIAVSELAKNLCDIIAPYHQEIIPLLLSATADKEDLVCIKSFYALSHYIGIEPSVVMPHLEAILSQLMPGLNHPNAEVKELAINAISACVSMAGNMFEPYFERVITIMKQWMSVTDPNLYIIRGRSMECIAALATSTTHEIFMPHFEEVVTVALNGLETVDSPELREFIYRFFDQMARVYAEPMSPIYPTLLPFVLASCQSSEGLVCENDEEALQMFPQESSEVNDEVTIRVLDSYMEEKAAAVSCLGWLIAENSDASASFIEASFEILASLTTFDLYTPVASAAMVSLVQVCSGLLTFLEEDFEWRKAEPSLFPESVTEALVRVFEKFGLVLLLPEQSVVRSAIESIGKLALTMGPSSVLSALPQIVKAMTDILRRQAPYQLECESFEENEEDFVTFSVVLDVATDLTKSCGKLFVPYLPDFFNCLAPYLQDETPGEYKECVFDCIARVAEELEDNFQPFAAAFIPVYLQFFATDSDSMIQQICMCLRMSLRYGSLSVDLISQIWPIVTELLKLDEEEHRSSFDCLYGLTAQILLTFPHGLPAEKIFPAMVHRLPLEQAREPTGIIWECLLVHLSRNQPTLMALLPDIVKASIIDLLEEDLSDITRTGLMNFLQQMTQSGKDQVNQIFASLASSEQYDPADLQEIHKLL